MIEIAMHECFQILGKMHVNYKNELQPKLLEKFNLLYNFIYKLLGIRIVYSKLIQFTNICSDLTVMLNPEALAF